MAIADADRCPKCGAVYMGAPLPGESPENRYCYTCATTEGNAQYAEQVASGEEVADDLALQPLEGGDGEAHGPRAHSRGNVRRQILRQATRGSARIKVPLKPGARPSAANIPVAAPVARPASGRMAPPSRQSSRTNIAAPLPPVPAIEPLQELSAEMQQEAAPQTPPARASATSLIPARQSASNLSPARKSSRIKLQPAAPQGAHVSGRQSGRSRAKNPAAMYGAYAAGGVAALLALVLVIKMSSGSTEPPKTSAPATASLSKLDEKKESDKTPEAKLAFSPVIPPATLNSDKVQPPANVASTTHTPQVKTEAAEVKPAEDTKSAAPAPAAPAAEKKSDVNDLLGLGGPRKAANAKADDDEDSRPTKPAAKQAEPEKAVAKDAAAAGQKTENGEKSGIAGTMDLVGLGKKEKEKEPEKAAETKKAVGPEPPQVSTEADPAIVPLDLKNIDGGDRAYAQQLQPAMPGWRVRDIHYDGKAKKPEDTTDLLGVEHRGRTGVVILNPINDVLPAKLLATIDIPAKYRSMRPVLKFEVSTKDPAHTWALQVKAANIVVIEKTPIKTKAKENIWEDIAVDLTGLSGKRFELVIEAYMTTKNSKLFPEQLAYFRNVRLEWTGKQSTRPQ